MKKIFVALFSAALLFAACDKYDDSALQSRVGNLESRVTELEKAVNDANANIASLQALVKALQDNITVDVISKTKDGYDITFSDGVTVSIANGEKGDTPVIGVKAEDNVFYWTVDGEWLLDANGERVIVTGAVPQVKIQDGKWFVSYDGKNWQDLGSSESMSGMVVSEDSNFVYLTVPGSGTTIQLSKSSRFTLDIATLDYMIQPGATTAIPYAITGADGTEKLFVQSDDFTVTYDAKKIYVTPKEGVVSGELLVMAVRNSDQAVCAVVISISEGVFEVTSAISVDAEGGNAEAFVKTNMDYEVIIPDEAKSWLSVAPETKAVRVDTLRFAVQPNESESARSANVEIKPVSGASLFVTVYQSGKGGASGVQAVTVAEFLSKPESTDVWYQLTGKISGSINTTYGNFDLVDESGSVYVYGLTATPQEKNDKSYSSLGLKAGDIVTLIGQRGSFNGKDEVLNAYYVSHVPGEDGDDPDQPGGQDGPVVTINLSVGENGVAYDGETVGDITLSVSNGDNKNGPKYYSTGSAVRFYGGNSFTLTSSSSKIISVEIEFGSGDGTNELYSSPSGWSENSSTWTGSASEVTFTVGGTSGHRRVAKIVVTLAE